MLQKLIISMVKIIPWIMTEVQWLDVFKSIEIIYIYILFDFSGKDVEKPFNHIKVSLICSPLRQERKTLKLELSHFSPPGSTWRLW